MTYFIYTLSDTIKDEVFYVGQTINPEKRFKEHIALLKLYSRPEYKPLIRQYWVQYLIDNGIPLRMELVEVIEASNRVEAERVETYWIHQFKAWGFNLKNARGLGRYNVSYKHKSRR